MILGDGSCRTNPANIRVHDVDKQCADGKQDDDQQKGDQRIFLTDGLLISARHTLLRLQLGLHLGEFRRWRICFRDFEVIVQRRAERSANVADQIDGWILCRAA